MFPVIACLRDDRAAEHKMLVVQTFEQRSSICILEFLTNPYDWMHDRDHGPDAAPASRGQH